MNKQINLIINGKGGVGKSFFATNSVQYLKDARIAHRAADSERENSTIKRFTAVATPYLAKILNFFVRASALRDSSLRSSKTLLPFPEIVIWSILNQPLSQLEISEMNSALSIHAIELNIQRRIAPA
jgi:CO dehydrogenase nickel-insertion accessory protein CooC1